MTQDERLAKVLTIVKKSVGERPLPDPNDLMFRIRILIKALEKIQDQAIVAGLHNNKRIRDIYRITKDTLIKFEDF